MFKEEFDSAYSKRIGKKSDAVRKMSKNMAIRDTILKMTEKSGVVCRVGSVVPASGYVGEERVKAVLASPPVQGIAKEVAEGVSVVVDAYASTQEGDAKRGALEVVKGVAIEAAVMAVYRVAVRICEEGKEREGCEGEFGSNKNQLRASSKLSELEKGKKKKRAE